MTRRQQRAQLVARRANLKRTIDHYRDELRAVEHALERLDAAAEHAEAAA